MVLYGLGVEGGLGVVDGLGVVGGLGVVDRLGLIGFLFKTERHIIFGKINSIYPPFLKLAKAKQFDILTNGINVNNLLPDPRN